MVLYHESFDALEHTGVGHFHLWGLHVRYWDNGIAVLSTWGMGAGSVGRHFHSSGLHALGSVLVRIAGVVGGNGRVAVAAGSIVS
ncbi:MAG: hypothetical protein LWX02_08215 [Deltaproteobacteria bacterium]|nr:hypothetical protein [Deltaproteobacteria bacterium]MDL1988895.1 hypothetical protein [Deltaproteobacteria bacterium]